MKVIKKGRGKEVKHIELLLEKQRYLPILTLFREIYNTPLTRIELGFLFLKRDKISTIHGIILKTSNPMPFQKRDNILDLKTIRNQTIELRDNNGKLIDEDGLDKILHELIKYRAIKYVNGKYSMTNAFLSSWIRRETIARLMMFPLDKISCSSTITEVNGNRSVTIDGLQLFDMTDPEKNIRNLVDSAEYKAFIEKLRNVWLGQNLVWMESRIRAFTDECIKFINSKSKKLSPKTPKKKGYLLGYMVEYVAWRFHGKIGNREFLKVSLIRLANLGTVDNRENDIINAKNEYLREIKAINDKYGRSLDEIIDLTSYIHNIDYLHALAKLEKKKELTQSNKKWLEIKLEMAELFQKTRLSSLFDTRLPIIIIDTGEMDAFYG